MKLKGDLDSLGIAELFKTLTEQHAVGILSICAPMGEKYIVLQEGSITIFPDKLAERPRMGDLLVARGMITDAQLAEALKHQRELEPRTRLGDLLLKKGFTGEDKIKQCLKFQLEEEVFDLFTWKGASFDFDSDKTLADVPGAEHLRGMSISDLQVGSYYDPDGMSSTGDPAVLISEAARRLEEWKEIQGRLPTPYLCFKLTAKAEEMAFRATRTAQLILKLLKEGRTLESTIKRSCLGRFETCKLVIKALDDGWLFPHPSSELRMLASEHRVHRRFHDALYVYRRLYELSESDQDRAQLQEMIDDNVDAILRAKASRDSGEGEAVSHKGAAVQYLRRQRIRRIALAVFCLGSFVLIVYLLLKQYSSKPPLSDAYRKAVSESDVAVSAGNYEAAMEIWKKLHDQIQDKESDAAKLVLTRLKALPRKFDAHVETQLHPIEALEHKGELNQAENAYRALLSQYPTSPLTLRMHEGLARITRRRETLKQEAILKKLQQELESAQALVAQKSYNEARARLEELLPKTPPESKVRKDTQADLGKLAEIAQRALQAAAAGELELQASRGEKALAHFEQAFSEWPELNGLSLAHQLAERTQTRLEQARNELARAANADKLGDITEAIRLLREAQKNFPEFELTAGLLKRISELDGRLLFLRDQLQQARDEFKKEKKRNRFMHLVKNQPAFLERENVAVPMRIDSTPPGLLSVAGKQIGNTPQEIEIAAGEVVTLLLERPGYQRYERRVGARMMPEDLELHVRLKREAVRVLTFGKPIFAPPRVIDSVLYILHGASLTALDPSGEKQHWQIDELFDENAATRPASNGTGPPEMVLDKSWWYPRIAPAALSSDTLLLPLRSREVLEIDLKKHRTKRLVTLPTEPVGEPYVDRGAVDAGKIIFAVATADGKVRKYDLQQGTAPAWERVLDPSSAPPKGTLIAGLTRRGLGIFACLSASGRAAVLGIVDGREHWSLDLKAQASDHNCFPAATQENVALLVLANGALAAVDFTRREKLWESLPARPADEAFSAHVEAAHFYIFTREGIIRKYPHDTQGKPTPLWERPLDGSAELPLVFDKLIYAVSSFGTIYAISPDNGQVAWDYRPERKPLQLSVHGEYVYVSTEDGRLLILRAH